MESKPCISGDVREQPARFLGEVGPRTGATLLDFTMSRRDVGFSVEAIERTTGEPEEPEEPRNPRNCYSKLR
jgi:hypothetical protein